MKMKQFLLITLCCLFAITTQAQTMHLKFMDIPLDGTIDQFQAKLLKKGVKLDFEMNKLAKTEPCRYFKGYFAGIYSTIKIKYHHKTKKVWGAMVAIEYPSKKQADSQLDYYKRLLLKKYPLSSGKDVVKQGVLEYMLSVYDDKDFYGFIYLYIFQDLNHKDKSAFLILNYKDYKNTVAGEKDDIEDL